MSKLDLEPNKEGETMKHERAKRVIKETKQSVSGEAWCVCVCVAC